MKILLVGYYKFAEGFKGAMSALKNNFEYDIEFFPLTEYTQEYSDENINILERFINHTIDPNEITPNAIYINNNVTPEVILWWNFNIDEKFLLMSKSYKCLNIFYCWDDPFWSDCRTNDFIFQHLDVVFTCCNKSINYYKLNGCNNSYYLPPGFDPEVHHPILEYPKYDTDVSIVCTNLYNDEIHEGRTINRQKLLQEIIVDSTINLKIYGPEFLREIFPDHYQHLIDFNDTHKIFSRSKININTHVRRDGDMYINERTCQILGSGGLLLVDETNGLNKILQKNKHCLFLDEKNILKQIQNILKHNECFDTIRKEGMKYALENFTWGKWANFVHLIIQKKINDKILIEPISFNYEVSDNILKTLYVLCCAIRISHYDSTNYLLLLSKICYEHNIDINTYLKMNIPYVINKYSLI